MDVFRQALDSKLSTIVFGHFGRHPTTVQFYLDSVRGLEPVSDVEPVFKYHDDRFSSRTLKILIEPPFEHVVASDAWTIVLTSHLSLSWDPRTTRVVRCDAGLPPSLPVEASGDHVVVNPAPTSHGWPSEPRSREERGRVAKRLDLSSAECAHEAYLMLLTFLDLLDGSSEWSLSIGERLRSDLVKRVESDPSLYDRRLSRSLG